ncbi:MAG: FAD-dependent monooxygenase [Chloroflexi bacterium]|nr:FAD-dependent monooxygenase [Chloroflexota bacterium]
MPEIVVIGAGLGGLCLAQGLRRAGRDVAVYERDSSPSARAQGYRISLDRRAEDALRACLPGPLFRLFEATRGQPSVGVAIYRAAADGLHEEGGMRFSDEPRAGIPARGHAVGRLVLREILLAGLEDAVHFGKEFTSYELASSGPVARFADGATVHCQALVGADGVNSRVRQQFLPGLSLVDSGMRWLGGRAVVDHDLKTRLPAAVHDRAIRVSDRGKEFFLASVLFPGAPNEAAADLWPGLRFTDDEDFLMWALVGQRGHFPVKDADLLAASEARLHAWALHAVEGCHPLLQDIAERSTPDRAFSLAIRAVPPVDAWPRSPITFVGDAIHASPVNGTGANAALEDAALFCQTLAAGRDIQRSLDEYEDQLLQRIAAMHAGFEAGRAAFQGRA